MRVCIIHDRLASHLANQFAKAIPEWEFSPHMDCLSLPANAEQFQILVAGKTIPDGLLSTMKNLKWVQVTGVGYDQIKIQDLQPDVSLTTAGQLPARAVAEFAVGQMIAMAKQIHFLTLKQQERIWKLSTSCVVSGKKAVCIGTGHIGSQVAKCVKALGLSAIGINRTGHPVPEFDQCYGTDEVKNVCKDADFLFVTIPADEHSKNLISKDILDSLPNRAYLISISRQSTIDTDHLLKKLNNGTLRGACLDSFDVEPLPDQSPFWDTPNLWISPHCAFSYEEHTSDLTEFILGNLLSFKQGKELLNKIR